MPSLASTGGKTSKQIITSVWCHDSEHYCADTHMGAIGIETVKHSDYVCPVACTGLSFTYGEI